MIKKWYNTIIPEMAAMTDISDEKILNSSSGEVNSTADLDDPKDIAHTLTDPTIFGKMSGMKNSMKMGHITLAVPVINVQYFKGIKPEVTKDLHMKMEDIDAILNHFKYVVVNTGNALYKYKQVLGIKEYKKAKSMYGDDLVALTGVDAIKKLLENDNVAGRQFMVLCYIPVLPLQTRYQEMEKDGKVIYIQNMLNVLYTKVISCNNRIKKLMELNAADIILENETRLLQVAVDQLISNGARGRIFCHEKYYIPAESLNELYKYINDLSLKNHERWTCHIDHDAVLESYRQYQDYYLNLDEGDFKCTDPRIEKLEKLSSTLDLTFEPFVNKYIEEIHPRYSDFKDIIFKNTICEMHTAVDHWLCPVIDMAEDNVEYDCIYKENNEKSAKVLNDMCDRLEHGIARCIDLYIEKQLKWNI